MRSVPEDSSQWSRVFSSTKKHCCPGGKTAAQGVHDLQRAEDKVVFLESVLTNVSVQQMGSSLLGPCSLCCDLSLPSILPVALWMALAQTFYSHSNRH